MSNSRSRRLPRCAGGILALLACVVAVGRAAARAGADEVVVEGRRVVVRSTVPSREVAERLRDALDAAVEVYERELPYRMPKGEKLVVHLYAEASEYADAVTAGGAGALAKNLAATLKSTKESYLVLQPRAEEAYLALVGGLPELTRFLACHEGVHQYLRRADAPGLDFWPDWYGEGMADTLAAACLAAGAAKDAPLPVHVDDKRAWVVDALACDREIGLERLLYAEQFTFRDLHAVYSHWEELYRLLAADPARLKRLHAAIGAIGLPGAPGAGARDDRRLVHTRACAEALAKVYGPLDALEEAWRRQTRATKPTWFEHVRASQRAGDEIVCAGFPGGNAILVSAAPAPGGPFTLGCEVNLLGVGGRQADLYLAFDRRSDARLLKLAFGADGYVTLLANSDGFWQERFTVNANLAKDAFPTGAWVPVEVAVDRARIRVGVGGKPALDAAVPPGFDVLRGAWGLGATNDVARFRKVAVTPARK